MCISQVTTNGTFFVKREINNKTNGIYIFTYQQDYQVYEQAQDQAYHFEEPHQHQFNAYQQHQYDDHHE